MVSAALTDFSLPMVVVRLRGGAEAAEAVRGQHRGLVRQLGRQAVCGGVLGAGQLLGQPGLDQVVPPVRSKRARPRRRPDVVLADRGYEHDKYRRLVWDLGVKPLIARQGTEHGSGLGTQRWVAERAFAHLHWFRRLRIRWEIRDDIHEAFLTLGCALICWRRLMDHRL
ncbi:hypothetical protein BX264_0026 [Streptomyces sp. 2333.5]|nr:hypothetical protein BX264_0026 [Streptomyces sp. 2333.5]SEB58917.1 hypothetical protein SAMN05428943_0026 [Streptomyces sp. 2314.4]SEC39977.1 hypothetical protein SAMN05428942_0026 [Streptomyces sp. 2112.2]